MRGFADERAGFDLISHTYLFNSTKQNKLLFDVLQNPKIEMLQNDIN